MSDLTEVAQLLHSKTMEGKLHWRLDGDRRVSITQGENFVDLYRSALSVKLSLRNKDGIELASEEFQFGYKMFQELIDVMEKVKRDALGVDEALDALKMSLSQL